MIVWFVGVFVACLLMLNGEKKGCRLCFVAWIFIQYYFLSCSFCFFGGASHQFFSHTKKTLIQGWLLFFFTFAISIHYSLLFFLLNLIHFEWWSSHTLLMHEWFFSLVIVQSNTVAIAHTFVNVIFCRWLMNRMFFFVCKIKIYKYYDTYSHGWLNWFDRTK